VNVGGKYVLFWAGRGRRDLELEASVVYVRGRVGKGV